MVLKKLVLKIEFKIKNLVNFFLNTTSNTYSKKINIFLQIMISYFLLIPMICSRNVSCDNIGICKITYSDAYEYIPKPFGINLNFFQDKYLKEDFQKYVYLNNTVGSYFEYTMDPNVEYLFGTNKYQCADGLDECPSKCCKQGICSDPSNVCLKYKNTRDLILIITGSLFLFFTIIYWIIFFYLGIKYNSGFSEGKNIKALDMIYRKPFKKLETQEAPDTEFNPNVNYEEFIRKKGEDEIENENPEIIENRKTYKNIENESVLINEENLKENQSNEENFIKNKSVCIDDKILGGKFANFAVGSSMETRDNKIMKSENENLNMKINENEIIEEEKDLNLMNSHALNNALLFSYNRFEESKGTKIVDDNFNGNRNKNLLLESNASKSNLNMNFKGEVFPRKINNNIDKNEEIIFASKENLSNESIQMRSLVNPQSETISELKAHKTEDNLASKIVDCETGKIKNIEIESKIYKTQFGENADLNKDTQDIFTSQNYLRKSTNRKLKRRVRESNEVLIRNSDAINVEEEKIKSVIEKDFDLDKKLTNEINEEIQNLNSFDDIDRNGNIV